MAQERKKREMSVLQASSLRELICKVNEINFNDTGQEILKEDIVGIQNLDGMYFLIYYK